MGRTFVKDPDAVKDYGIDWSQWLRFGESITASQWIIPDGLTSFDEAFSESGTLVWVSGGTAGRTYPLTNRITTSEGRTDDRTIFLRITNR